MAIYLVTKLKKNYLIPLNITEGKGYTIKKTAESIKTALKFDGSIIFDKNFIDGSPKKILKPKIFLDLFPNFKFHKHDQCIKKTVLYYKKLLK